MNIKIITAIIAFVATFGTSSALTKFFVGTNAPLSFFKTAVDAQTQQKMLTLIRQDIKNGEGRFDQLIETNYRGESCPTARLATYSKAVAEYQTKSASMDDADLPADFQAAWRQHMKAWLDHAVLVEKLKVSVENGETSIEEVYEELDNQPNEINRTWYKTLRIADKYKGNPYKAW